MSAPADNTLERFGIPDEESDPQCLVEPREQPETDDSDLDGSITDEIAAGELSHEFDLYDGAPVNETSPQYFLLNRCPLPDCHREMHNRNEVEQHLLVAHEPEDFGLAPTGEGRRRSTGEIFGDTVPRWEAQR